MKSSRRAGPLLAFLAHAAAAAGVLCTVAVGGCGTTVLVEQSGTGGAHPGTSSVSSAATTHASGTGGLPASSSGSPVTSSSGSFPVTASSGGFPVTASSSGFPVTASAASSGGSTTSSSGSSPCDMGTCDTCTGCAQNGPCVNQVFDCEFDVDCSMILCCSAACMDLACVQACISAAPAGAALFGAMEKCVDCSCVTACSIPPVTCP